MVCADRPLEFFLLLCGVLGRDFWNKENSGSMIPAMGCFPATRERWGSMRNTRATFGLTRIGELHGATGKLTARSIGAEGGRGGVLHGEQGAAAAMAASWAGHGAGMRAAWWGSLVTHLHCCSRTLHKIALCTWLCNLLKTQYAWCCS
jgi:hypothetical protein